MKTRFVILLFLAMTTFFRQAHASEMWVQDLYASGGKCSIQQLAIKGPIENGDSDRFDKLLKSTNSALAEKCKSLKLSDVSLNSEGGDIDAALALGRKIRQHEMFTTVRYESHCYSACVFLLAAGVVRTLDSGQVGIHRPYFGTLDARLTTAQVGNKRQTVNEHILEYLKEMDVSPSLLDAMLAVPPEGMKILSASELQHYRLTGKDANFDEVITAFMAKISGLSSLEYRQRDAMRMQMLEKCTTQSCPSGTYEAAFWGISLKQANERTSLLKSSCGSSKEDGYGECVKRIYTTGH